MAIPKYKKYPSERKGNENQVESINIAQEKDKSLFLLEKIDLLLKKPEKIDQAASIISGWIKRQN